MSMTGAQVFNWVVSLANFGIMFILFRLVVIIPMQEAVKLREQRVALRLKEIEEIEREAQETKAQFETRFSEVDTVIAEVKATADRSLAQVKLRLQEKAAAEERYVLEKAQAEAISLRHDTQVKVRSRVASDAVSRAERMLESALDSSAQDKILTASIQRVGELSAT